jgi:hypothetical protein
LELNSSNQMKNIFKIVPKKQLKYFHVNFGLFSKKKITKNVIDMETFPMELVTISKL